jgi:hypothetical protein
MTNVYIIGCFIAVTFLVVKFLEMRYIEKESKPLKFLIRDTLLVYFSVIVGNFVLGQLNFTLEGSGVKKVTPVFADNPDF